MGQCQGETAMGKPCSKNATMTFEGKEYCKPHGKALENYKEAGIGSEDKKPTVAERWFGF